MKVQTTLTCCGVLFSDTTQGRSRHRTRYPTCQLVNKQKTGRKNLGIEQRRERKRVNTQRWRANGNKVRAKADTELKNEVRAKADTELKDKVRAKTDTELKKTCGTKSVTEHMAATGPEPNTAIVFRLEEKPKSVSYNRYAPDLDSTDAQKRR